MDFVIDVDGADRQYNCEGEPGFCPICHHAIEALRRGNAVLVHDSDKTSEFFQIVYQCPRKKCRRLFLGQYHRKVLLGGVEYLQLTSVTPKKIQSIEYSKEIATISPVFVEIYNQAQIAEERGLDQIAGVGFRKALEFLVKDYCISKHPDQEDAIKKQFLGACINEYIEDTRFKACAKRAAWLGNDEAHFIRKWEDKDINDLKKLIDLSVHWISNEITTENFMKEMPET